MPELYAQKVRVRTSALIFRNETVLLVKQHVPTRSHPVWLPPGGGVELGERSEEALRREVFEETGLTLGASRLKYIHEFVEPPWHAVELYYITEDVYGEVKTGFDPELDDTLQQIKEVKFVPFSELEKISFSPDFLKTEIQSGNIFGQEITHYP